MGGFFLLKTNKFGDYSTLGDNVLLTCHLLTIRYLKVSVAPLNLSSLVRVRSNIELAPLSIKFVFTREQDSYNRCYFC